MFFMNCTVFSGSKWICCDKFADLEPINALHKQNEEIKIDTPDELKDIHMLVRKEFEYDNGDYPVKIRITADDYYKLYINGEFVGQGPAQGYHFNYYWNEYDISKLLKKR